MAELAEWDEELLMAELEGLAAEGITMDDVGFDLDALEELGKFNATEVTPPDLADGDRAPFRQATFTLHDEQWEEVEAALTKAKQDGGGESAVNENSNGNALAWICGRFNRG
jgi:ParB family chromosome partitioning protein